MSRTLYLQFLILIIHCYLANAIYSTKDPYKATLIANISIPRGLLVDESGDILILSRGSSSIISLYTEDNSISYLQQRIVNGEGLELNHGIAYNRGYLYASSGSRVYRWPYTPGQRREVNVKEQIVISNISVPDANKQNTRTIIFGPNDLLYVTINSDIRIELDSSRCRIRRFDLSNGIPESGIDFDSGELFADGVRNEVGLAFDEDGVLWGVENAGGADYLIRDDLGGNIHDGNPAEELNRFDKAPGTHYGYPYCFGSYDLKDYPVGTQFAWPTTMNDGIHTDSWCRNETNNARAAFFMPAHEAPLGIEFYKGASCGQSGAFPCSAKRNAVIAYHGSMNITNPVGYKVTMFTFNKGKVSNGETKDIIVDNDGIKSFRPVNAVFDKMGHLIVSSDASDEIIRISYNPTSDNNGAFSSNGVKLFYPILFLVALKYF